MGAGEEVEQRCGFIQSLTPQGALEPTRYHFEWVHHCAPFISQLFPGGPLGRGVIFQAFPDEMIPGGQRRFSGRESSCELSAANTHSSWTTVCGLVKSIWGGGGTSSISCTCVFILEDPGSNPNSTTYYFCSLWDKHFITM